MRKYWWTTFLFLGLFLALWMFRYDIPRKPLPIKPKISSPQTMPESMDLAGGPEREIRGFPKRKWSI